MLKIAFLLLFAAVTPVIVDISPSVRTESVQHDVDDPAIWVNPSRPANSLIVATIKRPVPDGGLVVYSLDGKLLETFGGIDRPNNVDILGGICVVTERLQRRLRVFRISAVTPHLRPAGEIPLFVGEPGESGAPMGVALYERRRDKQLFVIVSRKTGPSEGYLWQYRLVAGPDGAFTAEKVRAFGSFSGQGEIEAVAVDRDRELVYYSDEDCCVRVHHADPAARALSLGPIAQTGFKGNREGIAIAGEFVIVTDQLAGRSEYHAYNRDSLQQVAIWRGESAVTDGIDATSSPLGPLFPRGLLVAMNQAQNNFHLYAFPFRDKLGLGSTKSR